MQLSESTLLDHSADADAPWQGEAAQIEHAETAEPNASGLATIAELGKAAGAGSRSPIWHTGRIRKADILMFTSQLSIMCESGVDLAEALRDSADNCRHPRLKGVLDEVYNDVANGVPVSVAMQRHEHVFGGAYVGSIAAAESSGRVSEVLRRLSSLLRNEIRLHSSLVTIFSYPAALAIISSLVIAALIFFVLPQFGKVFERMQSPPPPFTQFLLNASAVARGQSLWIAGGSVLLLVAGYYFGQTARAREMWDRFVLDIGLFKGASRALLTGRSFRLLGTMLESGVPLVDSIRLCGHSIRNTYFRRLFANMEQDILNGNGLGTTVSETSFLPGGVAQMVTTAERTGRLGQVLALVGEFYEEEGERQIRQVVKFLEPVIIVLMGAVVAGVVASVMLPLLNVSTLSR